MSVHYLLMLVVSIIIFLITAIEYRYSKALSKFSLKPIKREENPRVFKLVIGMQILFGIVLLVLSIYNFFH
jgi:hypothetical protein